MMATPAARGSLADQLEVGVAAAEQARKLLLQPALIRSKVSSKRVRVSSSMLRMACSSVASASLRSARTADRGIPCARSAPSSSSMAARLTCPSRSISARTSSSCCSQAAIVRFRRQACVHRGEFALRRHELFRERLAPHPRSPARPAAPAPWPARLGDPRSRRPGAAHRASADLRLGSPPARAARRPVRSRPPARCAKFHPAAALCNSATGASPSARSASQMLLLLPLVSLRCVAAAAVSARSPSRLRARAAALEPRIRAARAARVASPAHRRARAVVPRLVPPPARVLPRARAAHHPAAPGIRLAASWGRAGAVQALRGACAPRPRPRPARPRSGSRRAWRPSSTRARSASRRPPAGPRAHGAPDWIRPCVALPPLLRRR